MPPTLPTPPGAHPPKQPHTASRVGVRRGNPWSSAPTRRRSPFLPDRQETGPHRRCGPSSRPHRAARERIPCPTARARMRRGTDRAGTPDRVPRLAQERDLPSADHRRRTAAAASGHRARAATARSRAPSSRPRSKHRATSGRRPLTHAPGHPSRSTTSACCGPSQRPCARLVACCIVAMQACEGWPLSNRCSRRATHPYTGRRSGHYAKSSRVHATSWPDARHVEHHETDLWSSLLSIGATGSNIFRGARRCRGLARTMASRRPPTARRYGLR